MGCLGSLCYLVVFGVGIAHGTVWVEGGNSEWVYRRASLKVLDRNGILQGLI